MILKPLFAVLRKTLEEVYNRAVCPFDNEVLFEPVLKREIRERVRHAFMVLSHDPRGPLTSLSAALEFLARGWYGQVDESAAIELRGILRQTIRLSGIVEDHLARGAVTDGLGEIQKEALDLRKDIIDPVLQKLADEIESRGITIEECPETIQAGAVIIHAGRRWIRSLYRNLITKRRPIWRERMCGFLRL